MQLAEARESSHPLDAVGVYEPIVFRWIDVKSDEAYSDAVELMSRMRELCDQANAPARFDALLANVRSNHAAKRNLMKLLDRRGWS